MTTSLRRTGWLWCVAAMVAVVVSCAAGPMAGAQGSLGIGGSWQGTAEMGKHPRVIMKVSRVGDAGWQGVMYLLDSGMAYEGHNTTTMSLEGGMVRFTIAPIDVRFEGKLSADGASITGTLVEGSGQGPIILARADGDAAWEIPKVDAPMAKDADPDWEVATVKPSDPDDTNSGFNLHGRRIVIERKTVEDMLVGGYGMHKRQLVGAPGWISSERWDVDGVPDVTGRPSLQQLQSMVRKILAERFGFQSHTEKREVAVYALTVAKGGPRLEKSAGDLDGLMNENDHENGGQRFMHVTNASMADFVLEMKFMMDRPLVDHTGLTGRYDFQLNWTFDDARVPTDGTAAPGLFTAAQEQLGLKMDAAKEQTDVLVIDKIERPSGN